MKTLPYTHTSEKLNAIISELMDEYRNLVAKAKSHGLDIKFSPDSANSLELYFHDDYPETLLVDKEVSCTRLPWNKFNEFVYEEIILKTEKDAKDVLEHLKEIKENYGVVTVADLYDLAGLAAEYQHTKHGWISVEKFSIVPMTHGFMISTPKPLPIY